MINPIELPMPEAAQETEQIIDGIWEHLELTEKVEILQNAGWVIDIKKEL